MRNPGLKIILTGSTGMVGEGVLKECIISDKVEKVLMINRQPLGISHHKITEVIHDDFFDLSPIRSSLVGYDACLFCLGVTSVGKTEEQYTMLTYTLTVHFAETLSTLNTDMTFCYISGAGTDRTEKGRTMWARVKGQTENTLKKLPFAYFYAFRPLFLLPAADSDKTHTFYKYISWLYPLGRWLFPNFVCSLEELAEAMIEVCAKGYTKDIIKGKDIIKLAKQYLS